MLQFAFIFAVAAQFDARAAERFANLALACVHKEYPNKISHNLNSDADVAPPRKLTPAFYGCYDWHSSVHGHWLLARLARTLPDATFTAQARRALQERKDGRVSSGRTDSRGCCSSALNCANRTRSFPQLCIRSSRRRTSV